jgi:hypothetical protein
MPVGFRQTCLKDCAVTLPKKRFPQGKKQIRRCLQDSTADWTLRSRDIPKLLRRNAKVPSHATQWERIGITIKYLTRKNSSKFLLAQQERNGHVCETSLVKDPDDRATPQCLGHRGTRNILIYAERAARPILRRIVNQGPNRLSVVAFS